MGDFALLTLKVVTDEEGILVFFFFNVYSAWSVSQLFFIDGLSDKLTFPSI